MILGLLNVFEPHRLSLVKLWILEGRQPEQAIEHAGGKILLGDVEKIAPDYLGFFWKWTFNLPLSLFSRWGQGPWIFAHLRPRCG